MVKTGWNNLDLAKPVENDEDGNKVAEYNPVDERSEESVLNSNFDQVAEFCSRKLQNDIFGPAVFVICVIRVKSSLQIPGT